MTPALPALPGESPDPSATPRLDALLREVDRHVGVETSTSYGIGVMDHLAARSALSAAAPRLAAMLRVAVEALYGGANLVNGRAECRAALARIERMAEGKL
jgi:hypothetical protein